MTSIIIIAHNGLEELTVPFMRKLEANTHAPYELICVDDGSSDGTYEYFRDVADIAARIPKRSGAAVARNVGMMAASGDAFAFLDNDTLPTPRWLSSLRPELRKFRVGIVAAIPSDERWRHYPPPSKDGLIDMNNVGGGTTLIKRAVFDRLGFLSTEFPTCGQDTDYCFRAWLAGFRVVTAPWVVIPHLGGGTRKNLNQEEIRKSRERFWRKWRPYAHLFPIRYPEVSI